MTLPTCPYCAADGAMKWGRQRNGVRRWRCTECWRTFSLKRMAGNHLPEAKQERLIEALQAGFSLRKAARVAGVARATAQKYAAGMNPVCPCGLDARHQGWCSFRVSRSPSRQRFLRERFGARRFHEPTGRVSKREAAAIIRALMKGTSCGDLAEQHRIPVFVVERLSRLPDHRVAELLRAFPVESDALKGHTALGALVARG